MKKLKITAIVSGILTLLQLLPTAISAAVTGFAIAFQVSEASAIGIIGGADGPTSIYTAVKFPLLIVVARYAFFAACVLTFIVSIMLLIKNRNKNNG